MSSSCWSWLWFTSLLCGKGFSFSSFVYVMISEVCPSSWRCSTYSCFWQWSSRCTSECWTGWYYCLPAYENHGLWNATVVWSERAMYSVYANLMIHYTLHTIIGNFFFVSTTLSSEHIKYKQVMRLFAFLFQMKLDLSILKIKKNCNNLIHFTGLGCERGWKRHSCQRHSLLLTTNPTNQLHDSISKRDNNCG